MMSVYGSLYTKNKTLLWDQLYHLEENIQDLWLNLGDFNMSLHLEDKLGGKRIGTSNDATFKGFMDSMGALKLIFMEVSSLGTMVKMVII